mmetsp:Transcript_27139/g.57635  ORF Transcript_27139/g.57635 Transcript_27139/m.57635 type:complete len:116 (-) Transcript_27139:101-448(-)
MVTADLGFADSLAYCNIVVSLTVIFHLSQHHHIMTRPATIGMACSSAPAARASLSSSSSSSLAFLLILFLLTRTDWTIVRSSSATQCTASYLGIVVARVSSCHLESVLCPFIKNV